VVTAPTEAEVAEVVAAAAEVDAGGGAEADATRGAEAAVAVTEEPGDDEREELPEPRPFHEVVLDVLSDYCDVAADGDETIGVDGLMLIAAQLDAVKLPPEVCGELARMLQAAWDGTREVLDEYIRGVCEGLWKRANAPQESKPVDNTGKPEVFVGTELPQYQPLDTGDDPEPNEDSGGKRGSGGDGIV
jgi:hypothetical protein